MGEVVGGGEEEGQSHLTMLRYASPVLNRREAVVSLQNGLHLFEVRVSVKRRVAAKQEVRDNTNSP